MSIPQLREGTDVLEFYRQLMAAAPLLDGKFVDITATATTSTQQTRHGLGRTYRGAFLVIGPSASVQLRVLDPDGKAEPDAYLYFALSAATAVTARAWVY